MSNSTSFTGRFAQTFVLLALFVFVIGSLNPIPAWGQSDDGAVASPVAILDDPDGDADEPGPSAETETDPDGAGPGAGEAENEPEAGEDPDAETPTAGWTDPPATPEPIVPALDYAPGRELSCTPSIGFEEAALGAGSYLDYDCELQTAIDAINLTLEEIAFSWTISIETTADWAIQIRTAPDDQQAWSDPAQFSTLLTDAEIDPAAAEFNADGDGTAESLSGVAVLSFSLRILRSPCSTANDTVRVTLTSDVSAPDHPDAAIVQTAEQAEPFEISLRLAPIETISPIVTVESFLISPTVFSLNDRTTGGTLTIHVVNPAYQCLEHDVFVRITDQISGEGGSAALTWLSEPLVETGGGFSSSSAGSGTPLSGYALVSTIPAGTGPGSYTQSLSFELSVPGQLAAGAFSVSASVLVEPEFP